MGQRTILIENERPNSSIPIKLYCKFR